MVSELLFGRGRVGSVSQANGTVQLNIDGQGPVALADIKRVM